MDSSAGPLLTRLRSRQQPREASRFSLTGEKINSLPLPFSWHDPTDLHAKRRYFDGLLLRLACEHIDKGCSAAHLGSNRERMVGLADEPGKARAIGGDERIDQHARGIDADWQLDVC